MPNRWICPQGHHWEPPVGTRGASAVAGARCPICGSPPAQQTIDDSAEPGSQETVTAPGGAGPCYYGIDTPTRAELIASSHTVEEIRERIGADSLGYLSEEGLLAAVDDAAGQRHCTACFSGRYPVAVSQSEDWQLALFKK